MSNDANFPTPLVTVVIPVKDDNQRLGLCLQDLSRQDYEGAFDVIIADNGSATSPQSIVNDFAFARLIQAPQNGSYFARNAAIRHTDAPVLAFTDSDCRPQRDWLRTGIESLAGLPDRAAVGGAIELFAQDGRRPTPAEIWELQHGLPQKMYVEQQGFAATANLFVTRDLFDQVGLFSETMISSGDREWGGRAAAAGYPITYVEACVVRHPCRRKLSELTRKLRRLAIGQAQLRAARGEPLVAWGALLKNLKPPFRSLIREVPKVRPKTPRAIAGYVVAAWTCTYVAPYEQIRASRIVKTQHRK